MRRARSLLAIALIGAASAARAQPAPPDSALHRFLGGLSDSTNVFFGLSATPVDTAGLDSALAVGLGKRAAGSGRDRRHLPVSYEPWLAFNRVDGAVYGGGIKLGRARRLGELSGRLAWANGPDRWLGGADYVKRWGSGEEGTAWEIEVMGGRYTATLDRDHHDNLRASLRAFVNGGDLQRYLRHDGFELLLERESPTLRTRLGYRNQLESPLPVTATWNLAHRELALLANQPAAFGRVSELAFDATARLPRVPAWAEASFAAAAPRVGSDPEYRRARLGLGAEIPLGRHAAAVPQLEYGRLGGLRLPQNVGLRDGSPVPQASFFLGGEHSLRSLDTDALGGSGLGLARLDVIGADDLLALAHIAHPAALSLQAGGFAAIGAAWGADPYGGPQVPGADWPARNLWRSEVGVSLLYRPGLPDPLGFMRFEYAWPVGGHRGGGRYSIAYSRALDLIHLIER